jgi:hypothetical protein
MAAGPRPTFAKRQRELKKQRAKQDKLADRARRRAEKADSPDTPEGEIDPDIAGIVPGPQPLPWDDEEAIDNEA